MAKKKRDRKDRGVCRADGGKVFGPVWVMGWLFTIGYCGMPFFWKGLLALLIWPYYLGMALR
jgi:hypothetical protein